ncbi:helix-turn-helix transcriptional regulator [Sinosporangium siamense]|nr:AraC family transcriptional regulator [Sinosporangium siamense]
MVARRDVAVWRPQVAGVTEVFHAYFTDHVYPMHSHETWTLLLIEDGVVRYNLDRHEHSALNDRVTLLPPHVAHNGTPVTSRGFRKRVIYLDSALLGEQHIGTAVDRPDIQDPLLRLRIRELHNVLTVRGEELESESRLTLVCDRLHHHLGHHTSGLTRRDQSRLAHRLRALLHARLPGALSLQQAAATLHAHPAHLIRAFTREFDIAPHQYVTACRIDRARRLLLEGHPPSEVATLTGFYDQPHLTRNFTRILGVAPGRYAQSIHGGRSVVREAAAHLPLASMERERKSPGDLSLKRAPDARSRRTPHMR